MFKNKFYLGKLKFNHLLCPLGLFLLVVSLINKLFIMDFFRKRTLSKAILFFMQNQITQRIHLQSEIYTQKLIF